MRKLSSVRGLSLIETAVYVGLLGIVMILITDSLIQIASVYQQARANREVLSNARLIMETINKDIAYSKEIYAPTSKFNTTNGQLSLMSALASTSQHTTGYLDIWSDGSRVLRRKEGSATTTLSAATVRVMQFRVERIFQALGREAIKIVVSISSTALPLTASTTLESVTSLRGNY